MQPSYFYTLTPTQTSVRDGISKLCANFDDDYWLSKDTAKSFPIEFYKAVAEGGWLGMTVPEEYGGSGLGVSEAAMCMQTMAESGAGMNGGTSVKLNMLTIAPLLKFGTDEQKRRILAPIMQGQLKACFSVTEPDAGLNTRQISTFARKNGDDYIISGRKLWVSTAQEADLILILTRTTPLEEVKNPNDGLTLFFTKLDRKYVTIRDIDRLGRNAVDANELFIDDLPVSKDDRIGEEGKGLYYVFQTMNAERIVNAAEGLGIGKAALERAAQYAKDRVVFGRPIGQNQGVQHPLAQAWMDLEALTLLVYRAAEAYDAGDSSGLLANTAKQLCVEAGYRACETALLVHGGLGYAREYHVERYLRDIMLLRFAPVSRELIWSYVAERALGLPKSY